MPAGSFWLDAEDMELMKHESWHCVAALSLGREIVSVQRQGRSSEAHGQTHSVPGPFETAEDMALVILAGVWAVPRRGRKDVESLDLIEAARPYDHLEVKRRVDELLADSHWREVAYKIEEGLFYKSTLSGEDIAKLLS